MCIRDRYYGLRYPEPATLLDHLDTPLFILDEVGGIRDAQKATEFRRSEELTGLLEEGVLLSLINICFLFALFKRSHGHLRGFLIAA